MLAPFNKHSSRQRLVVLMLCALLCACAGAPARVDNAAELAALRAQADRWDQAIVHKDRAAIAANMAEDFRQIDAGGRVADKAAFVDGVLATDLQIDPYTVEEFAMRRYGDVALLSGRTRMSGRYAGKPFQSHYRYTDVYVRRAGEWQVVSVQISPVAE